MLDLNFIVITSLSLIVFTASFCKHIFFAYGISPNYAGELDAYLPLFRILFMSFIACQKFTNASSKFTFTAVQAGVTLACFNSPKYETITSLIDVLNPLGITNDTFLIIIECVPMLLLWIVVAYIHHQNRLISWEPSLPSSHDMSDKLDEVKEHIKATTKEKLQTAQKAMEGQKEVVKRKIKEAEKFYDLHQKQINSSLIPDALSEKTISVIEEDKLSVSSIDSNMDTEHVKLERKTKTELAREEAYRKQQKRVRKRLEQLRYKKA